MYCDDSLPDQGIPGSAHEAAGSSIPAQFELVAAIHAKRVAIGSGSWQPTYAELDAASNSLAALIHSQCALRSRIVLIEQLDGPLIGSILGVMKAGNVVVVLNANEPLPRLQEALKDLEPAMIVTDSATRPLAMQAAQTDAPVTCFEEVRGEAAAPTRIAVAAEDLAILLRTSGSTGHPKWVMQNHRNILHQAYRHIGRMRIEPEDRVLLLASPSGSQAVATTLTALLNGAAVCPFPIAEKGIIGLAGWLRQHRITVYVSAASAFRYFLKSLQPDERFGDVRLIKLGAEPMMTTDLSSAARHFPHISLFYCTYSSSEAGSMAQLLWDGKDSLRAGRLPLGSPSEGIELLLLDERGHPVRDGEVGEIVVRGRYLSPGYWRDAEMTAERFSEVAAMDGVRCFRTADLARRESDGSLWHLGRRDHVVKIHGNRVDVGHVEDAVKALPGVQESVVCARTRPDGTLELAAFVVAKPGAAETAHTIRQALRATLPDVMLPAETVFLDRLPLNPHGKIDRQALANYTSAEAPSHTLEEFHIPTEQLLARIWEQALGAPCGRDTIFFERGGDSLTAGVVAALLEAALRVQLNMLDFVEYPKLRDLAARVDHLRHHHVARDLPPLARSPNRGPYPLSFAQEQIRTHAQSLEAHRSYTMARSYGLRGRLNMRALREAMTCLARRHEILRTTFPVVDGAPAQVVQAPEAVTLPLEDFSAYADARERAVAFLREQASLPLDLACGPLLRFVLIRISPDEHWLIRVSHQILTDAWSWKLYFQELEQVYESIVRGDSPRAESEGLQYGDYAVWERSVFAPGSLFRSETTEWWKNTLADQPPGLRLPFRRGPFFRHRAKPSDGVISSGLDAGVVARLGDLARRESSTYFGIGLAAFAALLSAVTGQTKVMIGSHVTSRSSLALQNIQGNFTRLVPLCFECNLAATFREWLSAVRTQVVEAQARAHLPPEELWKALRSAGVHPPPIQAIFGGPGLTLPARFSDMEFVLHTHRFDGLALAHKQAAMPWGFTFSFDLNNGERPCDVTFDARLYHPVKVRRFLQQYLRLLDRLSLNPDRTMRELMATDIGAC